MAGPLEGLRIVEMAGIGPGPFAGMMLADHGAEVIRVERPGAGARVAAQRDVLARGRRSIALDVKSDEGRAIMRELCKSADGLIEGYRPGVMERLGLGPDVLLEDNPRLVYGRMTGWGQDGPYADAAGHDINYIALSGALYHLGRAGGKPTAPINMVGDFGGGGMMLAYGMVSALLHVARGGEGQVIDAAMTDGSALLMGMIWGMRNAGVWTDARGTNALDTGTHYYDTYQCADGEYISIGSIEPQFYAELRRLAELEDDPEFDRQHDPAAWGNLKTKLATLFRTRTRQQWCDLMEHTDVCFAPVLSMGEAPDHPHNKARGTFVEVGGDIQPGPAPRYSATQTEAPQPGAAIGADGDAILGELGWDADRIAAARENGAIG